MPLKNKKNQIKLGSQVSSFVFACLYSSKGTGYPVARPEMVWIMPKPPNQCTHLIFSAQRILVSYWIERKC